MRAVRASLLVLCLACATWVQAEPSFPTLTGRVVDAANVLDAGTKDSLTEQLAQHEAQSSNQIVVATVPSLEGYDVADYGVQLARHWQIGTAENDNGVLLLVAPKERKVRIEVGYGLEGALPDALAGDIIRKRILPSFRENDYSGGVSRGVSAITDAIKGEYDFDPSQASQRDARNNLHAIIPFVFITLMFGSHVARRRLDNRRISQAIVPAGFAGMVALIVSNNPFIAFAVALGIFGLIFLSTKNNGGSASPYRNRSDGTGGGMSGGGGGGGFSGGGGGFGGGGASGGW